MKIKMIAFIAIASLLLSSCANNKSIPIITGTTCGIAGGAATWKATEGLNTGMRILSTLVGTGISGGICAWLGNKWTETDKQEAITILNDPKDTVVGTWKNPDNHNQFKMTALKASNSDGQTCRQFKLVMNGEPPKDGKACKNKRGGWDFQDV
jgi:surface antigen